MLQVKRIGGLYFILHRNSGLFYKYSFIGVEQVKTAARKLTTGMEKGTESKDLKRNFLPIAEDAKVVDVNFRPIAI